MSEQANKAPPRVFIWDLDDTLIWTSWAYSRTFAKFHKYMTRLFDYRLLELRTLGTISEELDKALIGTTNSETGKPYGYSMERFPMSLVETYKWLCGHGYGKYHEMVARRVKLIGMEAFDPLGYKQQGLVKGAQETLDFIRDQGDVQVLLTKGEPLVQDYKIVALELEKWFGEEINITKTKSRETFEKYRKRFPGSVLYSVGNSYSSDIQPALEAGVEGIFIPYYTWLGEEPPPTTDNEKVFELKEVREIIGLYKDGRI